MLADIVTEEGEGGGGEGDAGARATPRDAAAAGGGGSGSAGEAGGAGADRVLTSPAVRRLAREAGIDLTRVRGAFASCPCITRALGWRLLQQGLPA